MKYAQINTSFWSGKNVFLTGHTGFKGSWLAIWLTSMGARVTGYSLAPDNSPNLYEILRIQKLIHKSHIENILDLNSLKKTILDSRPEILIHMAAQSLVEYGYDNPVGTYATNIMGTVNVLEASRNIRTLRATVIVSTDKCYENKEWHWGYREIDRLGGSDPYSSSKACVELVTKAYQKSFFSSSNEGSGVNKIATARAGNVIGGGDWSTNRLIPDALRAFDAKSPVIIRNPKSTRPWQHVLEPLGGYLMLAESLFIKPHKTADSYNFGPNDNLTVEKIITLMCQRWGEGVSYQFEDTKLNKEAVNLKLDNSKANAELGWTPVWSMNTTIDMIVDWHKALKKGGDMVDLTLSQINQYTKP